MNTEINSKKIKNNDKNKVVKNDLKIIKIVKENNIQNEKWCRLISGDINYII